MKIFVVLYVALVGLPTGEVQPVVRMVPSYIGCLQMMDTPKNKKFTFLYEKCEIRQVEVPDTVNKPEAQTDDKS